MIAARTTLPLLLLILVALPLRPGPAAASAQSTLPEQLASQWLAMDCMVEPDRARWITAVQPSTGAVAALLDTALRQGPPADLLQLAVSSRREQVAALQAEIQAGQQFGLSPEQLQAAATILAANPQEAAQEFDLAYRWRAAAGLAALGQAGLVRLQKLADDPTFRHRHIARHAIDHH